MNNPERKSSPAESGEKETPVSSKPDTPALAPGPDSESPDTVSTLSQAVISPIKKPLGKLFTTLFYISAFTFGGGFVIVSLMKKKYVDELHWMTEEQMLDMTAIAQSSPGAIAVNAAIQVGFFTAGGIGAAVAVLATILPPMLILSVVSLFYTAFRESVIVSTLLKGMQIGVGAVLLDVTCNLGGHVFKSRDWLNIVILFAAFGLAFFTDINIIFIILGVATLGILRAILGRGRKEG